MTAATAQFASSEPALAGDGCRGLGLNDVRPPGLAQQNAALLTDALISRGLATAHRQPLDHEWCGWAAGPFPDLAVAPDCLRTSSILSIAGGHTIADREVRAQLPTTLSTFAWK